MTVPTEESQSYTTNADDEAFEQPYIAPFPVYIAGTAIREQAAHFGALQGTAIPLFTAGGIPIQVTRRRPSRHRTVISNPQASPNCQVLLSNNVDSLQLSPPIGYPMDSGTVLTLESQQPVYAVCAPGTATAVTLGVLDEAWESKDGN